MTIVRDKMIERIRKLRAKGANEATTEEEANAFLDAAARLMKEYAVEIGDLDRAGMDVKPIEKKGVHISARKHHPACQCLRAIARLTGTHIGVAVSTTTVAGRRTGEVGSLLISGRPEDRQIADYMFDQVRNLIDGAWKVERERRLAPLRRGMEYRGEDPAILRYLLQDPELKADMKKAGYGIGAHERRSFGFGMAHRLARRIEAMAVRHKDSANALVVWEGRYQNSPGKKRQAPDLDVGAYTMGDRAGKDAALGAGVASGQRSVLQLETDER